MAQSASFCSFNGYQINQTHLALEGDIGIEVVRQLRYEQLSEIFHLTLTNCNSQKKLVSKLRRMLPNVTHVTINDKIVSAQKLRELVPDTVTHLTFGRCSLQSSITLFPLSELENLVQVDLRQIKKLNNAAAYLSKIAPDVRLITRQMPKPDDLSGTKRRREPETELRSPPAPRGRRVKAPLNAINGRRLF
jgi:hypothetical protein